MALKIEAELVDIQKCVDALYEKVTDFQFSELAHLHMTSEWQDADEAEKAMKATPEYKTYIKADKANGEVRDALEATPEYKDHMKAREVLEATLEYTNQVELNKLIKGIEKLKKEYKAYATMNAHLELYRTIKITNDRLMRDLEEARKIYKEAKEVLNNEK